MSSNLFEVMIPCLAIQDLYYITCSTLNSYNGRKMLKASFVDYSRAIGILFPSTSIVAPPERSRVLLVAKGDIARGMHIVSGQVIHPLAQVEIAILPVIRASEDSGNGLWRSTVLPYPPIERTS